MRSDTRLSFLCDRNLGKLARWLRLMGFDTVYLRTNEPEGMRRAADEGRVILTRKASVRGDRVVHIGHDRLSDQVRQLAGVCDLTQGPGAFTRCCLCNEILTGMAREDARGKVPEYVYATRESFSRCPRCGRIYWRGTHHDRASIRMQALLKGGRT
ncbi:MAG TPA: Mut7-C RNAse domain-containing protein [Deltaproteobacteria bacterium]|nr:Mut7-C RNAse domain-containing protein [Deltaproteobacteria bacterium]HQI80406.1 Mut7-C RNAse domain-containing protein [Deltaproteobacteria bacterium]